MAINAFITSDEIRTRAVKKQTFDTEIIDGNIVLAQERHVRPVLGEDYYSELQSQSPNSYTADNAAVMEYLKNALAYFVLYESFAEQTVKLTNKGAMVDLSPTSEPASDAMLNMRRTDLMSKAQSWLKIMRDFIRDAQDDDATKYPLFSTGYADDAQSDSIDEYIG